MSTISPWRDATRKQLESRLRAGLAALSPGTEFPVDALLHYLWLLDRWNRTYNLTAVREPADMIAVHLLDSLSILPYLQPPSLLDVGSGAGLPGLPLALARPDLQVTLLDSNGKKTRFLMQACMELGATNIEVVRTRAQDYRPPTPFSTIVSRACARLDSFVRQVLHLCARDGVILAMKARFGESAETDDLPAGLSLDVLPLNVPDLDAPRTLVRVRPGHGI